METIWSWDKRVWQLVGHGRRIGAGGVALVIAVSLTFPCGADKTSFHFPTVPAKHKHVRELLENSLRYVAPENKIIDPSSGYPLEGWNNEPDKKLFLRSFTQLTAIGQWMEFLANVAAGYADTPYFTREQALAQLTLLVKNLRQDQRDPQLSAHGLLGNFLDVASGKRLGPLTGSVQKRKFLDAFGREQGEAIWKALQAQGWIVVRPNETEADVQRTARYGWDFFNGALAPYSNKDLKQRIMALLDQRVVMVIFGDNANLSASVARTLGALLVPDLKDDPRSITLRQELEGFLETQRDGYTRLYDANVGLFYFGRDATKDRWFGWEDPQGEWKVGHMDYLVNEFRGPATFVVLRFGLPTDAIKNLGFKIKPYRTQAGREVYALAPWEGSAFQALGLELSLMGLNNPSWRTLLENVVDIEIDYADRKKLPGFLSESYTGEGIQYTGNVGIPEISVNPTPRVTDAASLYSLGPAYSIAPDKVEQFLADHWPVVSKLLTAHGPWEGFNVTRQEVIPFQTSAHTLSLILGFLGTGSDHMKRYLDSKGLSKRLGEIFEPGEPVDFLSEATQVFAWGNKEATLTSAREKGAFHVKSDRVNQVGLAFVPKPPVGVNLSGGLLHIRYRSAGPKTPVVVALKPAGKPPAGGGLIPMEIYASFGETGGREEEIQVPLPTIPGLAQIKEVVITSQPEKNGRPIDLTNTGLECKPIRERSGP